MGEGNSAPGAGVTLLLGEVADALAAMDGLDVGTNVGSGVLSGCGLALEEPVGETAGLGGTTVQPASPRHIPNLAIKCTGRYHLEIELCLD